MIVMSLVWILATLIAVRSAAVVAKRLGRAAGSFAFADAIVIAWTWVFGVAAALSVFECLTGPALLVGVPIAALATVMVQARTRRSAANAATVDVGVSPSRWPAILWACLVCFGLGHVVTGGLLRFTMDFDSLMYHLPLVDYWLQAGSLHAPASGHWSNPGNNELLALWSVAPFPNDCLALLGNIPATLLLAFASLELGRLLGLVPAVRHPAAMVVVANFVVMRQLIDAENDVAVAGLFLVCLCYGLRGVRGDRAAIVLGPAALGLLCGVKYYALGLAAVAWTFAVILYWSRRGTRAGLSIGVLWALGAILVGGGWYLRNAIATGSPLYPMVRGSGNVSFSTGYPEPWKTSFAGNGRPEVWPLALEAIWKMTGPCQSVAVCAFPTILLWLILGRAGSIARDRNALFERRAFALSMAGSAAVLAITPMALEDVPGTLNHLRWAYTPVRYGLSTVSLATLGLILALQDAFQVGAEPALYSGGRDRAAARRAAALGVGLAALAGFQVATVEGGVQVNWPVCLALAVTLGPLSSAWSPVVRWLGVRVQRRVMIAGGCFATALATWAIGSLSTSWDNQFTSFYGDRFQTGSIDALGSLMPKPTKIAYCDYRCYPFFGPRRSVSLCQERQILSYEDFQAYLHRWKVSHVIVRSDDSVRGFDGYRSVMPWLELRRDVFEKVYSDATHAIYRAVPPGRGSATAVRP